MINNISIQGYKASFHDIAARDFFGETSERTYCDTFAGVFDALKNDQSHYALCAIENSIFGSINEVYDLVLKNRFYICGEVYLRVEQCLIGLPETSLDSVTKVYSHPVALSQCDEYLNQNLPKAERLEYQDTATSVKIIKEFNNPSIVAIASKEAAKLYGMKILARSIETNKENYTRFIVLSKNNNVDKKTNKTSIVIKTSHVAGALYNALGSFANRSLSLSKIQSRPIIGKAWHYMFYIDIDAGINDEKCKDALSELNDQGCEVTVLGSYRAAVGEWQ